jgi:hypothetical protein
MSPAERLSHLLDTASPRLAALSDAETSEQMAGHWSKKEILGHLIDSASNNHQRFVRALLAACAEFPAYEQGSWVSVQRYGAEPWDGLVNLWLSYNRHLVHVLHAVPVKARAHTLSIGGSEQMTLGFVIDDYLRHLEHHLDQILS